MLRELLPDVVIGGAPRSGTTFLCEVLAKHPGAFVAQPFVPEPKVLMTPHPLGDAGYRDRYRRFFANAPADSVRVEKTSYYLENEEARKRFVRILPDTRVVFILRDPVGRAYSNWLWSKRNGLETLGFAEAIAVEGKRPNPLPIERDYARPFDYLARGHYGTYASAWISAIGRARIAFYILEEVLADLEPFIQNLQNFVGVEPLPWSHLRTGVVNANDLAGEGVDRALMFDLRERLAPEMEILAEVTGLSLSRWGYDL